MYNSKNLKSKNHQNWKIIEIGNLPKLKIRKIEKSEISPQSEKSLNPKIPVLKAKNSDSENPEVSFHFHLSF